MRTFLVGCLLALLMTSQVMAAQKYKNGIDANYPPFAYIDEKTGKPAGFDVESMDWIAKAMGFEVTHEPLAWDGIIPALLAKQIDMVCSGMSITEERAKIIDFSKPYWTVSRVFLVKTDSDLTPQRILSGKILLGVQRGTSEANDINKEKQEKGYPFELRFYDSSPLAVEDIVNGRIQAALMDELPADDAIAKGRPVKKAGTHGEPDNFGVAVRKSDTKLRSLIDEGYRKLMADPHWKALKDKYLAK